MRIRFSRRRRRDGRIEKPPTKTNSKHAEVKSWRRWRRRRKMNEEMKERS